MGIWQIALARSPQPRLSPRNKGEGGKEPTPNPPPQSLNEREQGEVGKEELKVYHVLNNSTARTWADLLNWLRRADNAPEFKAVSPREWVGKMASLATEEEERRNGRHPALKLLGLWKNAVRIITPFFPHFLKTAKERKNRGNTSLTTGISMHQIQRTALSKRSSEKALGRKLEMASRGSR